MKPKISQGYRVRLAAGLLIISGVIFMVQRWHTLPLALDAIAFTYLFVGVMWVLQPRQPYILTFEPENFSGRVLKWLSAPQIEAAVLFWFGMSFLAQPDRISIYRLTDSIPLSLIVGWAFLLLGYLLLVRMPTPQEYTLIAGVRLLYTILVAVDIVTNNGALVVVGAYVGGVLHGIISIALHWHLASIAKEVVLLKRQIVSLEKG